jgi:hypothetical protein
MGSKPPVLSPTKNEVTGESEKKDYDSLKQAAPQLQSNNSHQRVFSDYQELYQSFKLGGTNMGTLVSVQNGSKNSLSKNQQRKLVQMSETTSKMQFKPESHKHLFPLMIDTHTTSRAA